MHKRIVTLTLNPAVDSSCSAERVKAIHKVRTTNERYDPGGGGINVARVLNELEAGSFAVYLAGGRPGDVLDELIAQAGVMSHRVHILESTRMSHVVFEESSGQEFRFTPEGPQIRRNEWQGALDFIEMLDFDYVVASGSLPRGVPEDVYARLAVSVKRRGGKLILDTSGPALAAALEEGVYMAKPSRGEFAGLMGRDLEDPKDLEEAARECVAAGGVELLAITLGHDGAVLATRDGIHRLATPEVTARSAVGAGDSFVAGMTFGLSRGEDVQRAFALGVAAGTATVLTSGTELCHKSDIEHFWKLLLSGQASTAT
ncbi:1-phosphofructokinase family hexose kinase [Ectothiorhodospira sp. BSL-9]|uniref:1-phosphofructokinase family hexose kinase n=1 Tax=Ectothiorhodospira sp. BSL-9 TaxID=1442136 RepID=UPI0007B44A15|nr:1-phosphofructokinase family hexose kinase [Ectothiorhodospira sp. BSL-9]ANB02826.1 1-phosphofructokinase [Ectothiorhodospira sp. BSL-9]TVQ73206.1 MAG: 1-phosphofructokinase family hexose kinase [Chromatiaceae bacterium]